MSRPNQVVAQFPALDHEPRGHGPPPSYRNSAATEDSWSTMSGSNGAMGNSGDKRRSSWNNLVQVGGDPMVPKQAPPRPALPQMSTTFAAIGSRTSSEMGIPQTVHTTQFSAHGQALPMQKVYSNEPRLVSVPRPAGTIQTGSVPGSRAGSVVMSMSNPSPPIIHKSIDSKMNKKPKRNRLQEIKNFCARPRFIGCALCLLMALIIAVIIIIVLTQVLPSPKQATFNWVAPTALTNGQNVSSQIEMKVQQKERIRFEMKGAAPMKGNFINYYDFNNNQAVVIDQALQVNGRNLYCFIVPIDRQAMPNPGQVRKAAKNSVLRHQQTEGWQETWTFIPAPIQQANGNTNMFNPIIPECNGSRIVQLQATSDQKNRRCTDCYDFCLPEYGIMRDASKGNEEYLNIIRRDCFYLFVPEWRTYAQANSIEQNQQDFENYYRNRQHMQVSYTGGPNDSRWIPLSGMPRQMMNATGNMMNQVGNAVSQFGSNIYGAVTGNQPNQPNQQQQQQQQNQQQLNQMLNQQNLNQGYQNVPGNGNALPNGMLNLNNNNNGQNINTNGYSSPNNVNQFVPNNPNQPQNFGNNPQPAGYHPAVNGVVNLNGVNGMVGNSEYNTQQLGPQPSGGQNQAIAPDMRRNAPYSLNSLPLSEVANINRGFALPQSPISSGNSASRMNGFGAQPSYESYRSGYGGSSDPRNAVVQQQTGHNTNNNMNPSNPTGQRIGTVLNEFGNPVNVHGSQPQPTYNNIQTSMGLAPIQSSYRPNVQQQQNMNQNPNLNPSNGGSGGSGYRPDVQPIDYNVPIYNQPNRPDALNRQGRIFK